jgi:hypothetical protein
MIAVAVVAGLALAVLAAALVKLAGNSGSARTPVAPSVTQPASVTSPGTATIPAPTAATPPATAPSASTPVAAAAVGLEPVTMLPSSIVKLKGAVDPQGVPTTYQFQYGPTANYGGRSPPVPVSLGAGTSAIAVFVEVRLAPGTTYHYKLTASKAGRAISTADATFTTPGANSPPGARSTTPAKTGASGRAP